MSIRSFILFILLSGILVAQGNTIFIAFEDLPDHLEKYSPHIRILNAEKNLAIAAYDAGRQWTNPELVYEHEEVKMGDAVISENMLSLSKSFHMPWNYWMESNILESDTLAADLNLRQNKTHLLSKIRNGYVRIGLLHNLSDQLNSLKVILDNLNQTIKIRAFEGDISKLESSLLSIGLFGLESDILETQVEYSRILIEWKENLGIPHDQILILSDSISFKSVNVEYAMNRQILENHPGIMANDIQLDAMDRRISLEKARIVPSISLSGGYKKINDGWEGFIAGFSIPLPILNWNQPQVETQKIEHQKQLVKSITYKQKLHNGLQNITYIIHAKSDLLQKYNDRFQNLKGIEDMVIAYQEGQVSLADFLNAIQLYRSSHSQYFEQLSSYYKSVFDLEALSGRQLVTF